MLENNSLEVSAIDEAIDLCGLNPLAAQIGVSYQAVQKYQKNRVTPEKVIAISEATQWKVTPHRLRPDLYPYKDDAMPPDRRNFCVCCNPAT